MKEIIAHIDIHEAKYLPEISNFIHMWNYNADSFAKAKPQELGCLEVSGIRIRFFADIESEDRTCYKIRNV